MPKSNNDYRRIFSELELLQMKFNPEVFRVFCRILNLTATLKLLNMLRKKRLAFNSQHYKVAYGEHSTGPFVTILPDGIAMMTSHGISRNDITLLELIDEELKTLVIHREKVGQAIEAVKEELEEQLSVWQKMQTNYRLTACRFFEDQLGPDLKKIFSE